MLMVGSRIALEAEPTPLGYAAPTGLAADVGGEYKVDLTWTDNATGEDGYQAFSSLDQVEWRLCGTSGANTETMTVGGFTHNTDWYFKVRAFSADGYSDFSGTATVNIPDVSLSNIVTTVLVTGNVGGGDWHGRPTISENANGD